MQGSSRPNQIRKGHEGKTSVEVTAVLVCSLIQSLLHHLLGSQVHWMKEPKWQAVRIIGLDEPLRHFFQEARARCPAEPQNQPPPPWP
jgi:hypothetical protein